MIDRRLIIASMTILETGDCIGIACDRNHCPCFDECSYPDVPDKVKIAKEYIWKRIKGEIK